MEAQHGAAGLGPRSWLPGEFIIYYIAYAVSLTMPGQ